MIRIVFLRWKRIYIGQWQSLKALPLTREIKAKAILVLAHMKAAALQSQEALLKYLLEQQLKRSEWTSKRPLAFACLVANLIRYLFCFDIVHIIACCSSSIGF